MDVHDYNIHNILTFRIVRNRDSSFFDRINLRYSFFTEAVTEKPDIILNIQPFKPQNDNCYIVDHNYYVKKNYFYCREHEGKVRCEFEIIGFEEGTTIINYYGKTFGFQSLINHDYFAQNLLLKIIEFKLLEKGYLLLHAAGLGDGIFGYVLPGRGGMFKTSICMDFVRNAGFNYFGDDRVIINEDYLFGFPQNLRLFSFMCQNLKNEKKWNMYLYLKYLYNVLINKKFDLDVGENINYKVISIIQRTTGKEIIIKKIDSIKAIKKIIVLNNRLEDFIDLRFLNIHSSPFMRYMTAYSFVYPNSSIALYPLKMEDLVERIFKEKVVFKVCIPQKYNADISKSILNFFNKLEGRN